MKKEKHNIDSATLSMLVAEIDAIDHDLLLDSYDFSSLSAIDEAVIASIYRKRINTCLEYLDAVKGAKKPDNALIKKVKLIHDFYTEMALCPVLSRRIANNRSRSHGKPSPYRSIGDVAPDEIVAREKAQVYLREILGK